MRRRRHGSPQRRGDPPTLRGAVDPPPSSAQRERASHDLRVPPPGESSPGEHSLRSVPPTPCSSPGTRPPAPRRHSERHAVQIHVPREARAVGRPRREPSQSDGGGAKSAICSRIVRISSRSSTSAVNRRTSSTIDERTRRRAAASRSAVRTASESLRPPARMTSSAADELSSRRTWRARDTIRV